MKVQLVSLTKVSDNILSTLPEELQTAEGLMAYTARVSSPTQDNPSYEGLLKYCIKNQHWSVFEMADLTVEITTSRAIAQQILRHRSFVFQEFSQRYSVVTDFEIYEARSQDVKNRQNSIDDMSEETKAWFLDAQRQVQELSSRLYKESLDRGIAKEQARFLLPLSVQTRLYMKGSLRSWVHYVSLRGEKGTQKEHRDIALAVKEILAEQFPTVIKALG